MKEILKTLKEKYRRFYTYSGCYRKNLMKQEGYNPANVFDHFSRLTLRLNTLKKCRELKNSTKNHISGMLSKISEFDLDIEDLANKIFGYSGDNVHKLFGEGYDIAASVVEGFELEASKYLIDLKNLSEDAKLIQRRTHYKKKHRKNIRRSNSAKMAWRKGKKKHINAIKKFHKSSAGKQFHRNLSRYQKLRQKSESVDFKLEDGWMVAKGLSSMITHLVIEIENSINDNVEKINEEITQHIESCKELLSIFNEVFMGMVEACFDDDKEGMSDVLEVVGDYYQIVEEK